MHKNSIGEQQEKGLLVISTGKCELKSEVLGEMV